MTYLTDPVNSRALVVYTPPEHPLVQARASMERILNLFMEKSFKAQVADYGHFHRHWMGDIIVLVGTSTAGKTSIVKALRKLEPNRIEDGGDLRIDAVYLEYSKKHCPAEVAILEKVMKPLDIPKAVFSQERPWKMTLSNAEKIYAEEAIGRIKKVLDSLSEEEMNALTQNIDPLMVDEAFEISRRGGSIIFDIFNIDAFARQALMRNFNGPVRAVLVYCPFHLLSSRIEKRNKEAEQNGNFFNQRLGDFPLMQFSEIYTRKETGQRTLEVVTREQAISAYDGSYDQGVIAQRNKGCELPSNEEILRDKTKCRQHFLDNLGFTDNDDRVEIAPRNQHLYHLLINSGQLPAEQSAKILHEGI